MSQLLALVLNNFSILPKLWNQVPNFIYFLLHLSVLSFQLHRWFAYHLPILTICSISAFFAMEAGKLCAEVSLLMIVADWGLFAAFSCHTFVVAVLKGLKIILIIAIAIAVVFQNLFFYLFTRYYFALLFFIFFQPERLTMALCNSQQLLGRLISIELLLIYHLIVVEVCMNILIHYNNMLQ